MFQVGDEVFYINSKQETFSGRVLDIKKRIKISFEHTTGQITQWVDSKNVRLQDTERCAHNAECGLCGDTGKCYYS